mmetsp:Transcript_67537/g.201863  ORF Transcript_67537/g.201863 Transcript_67537/m.201863 type:complete len:752 (-) Transcript_67537:1066-3321(-)
MAQRRVELGAVGHHVAETVGVLVADDGADALGRALALEQERLGDLEGERAAARGQRRRRRLPRLLEREDVPVGRDLHHVARQAGTELLLRELFEHLLAAHRHDHLVVVARDGGATDGVAAVLEALAQRRVEALVLGVAVSVLLLLAAHAEVDPRLHPRRRRALEQPVDVHDARAQRQRLTQRAAVANPVALVVVCEDEQRALGARALHRLGHARILDVLANRRRRRRLVDDEVALDQVDVRVRVRRVEEAIKVDGVELLARVPALRPGRRQRLRHAPLILTVDVHLLVPQRGAAREPAGVALAAAVAALVLRRGASRARLRSCLHVECELVRLRLVHSHGGAHTLELGARQLFQEGEVGVARRLEGVGVRPEVVAFEHLLDARPLRAHRHSPHRACAVLADEAALGTPLGSRPAAGAALEARDAIDVARRDGALALAPWAFEVRIGAALADGGVLLDARNRRGRLDPATTDRAPIKRVDGVRHDGEAVVGHEASAREERRHGRRDTRHLDGAVLRPHFALHDLLGLTVAQERRLVHGLPQVGVGQVVVGVGASAVEELGASGARGAVARSVAAVLAYPPDRLAERVGGVVGRRGVPRQRVLDGELLHRRDRPRLVLVVARRAPRGPERRRQLRVDEELVARVHHVRARAARRQRLHLVPLRLRHRLAARQRLPLDDDVELALQRRRHRRLRPDALRRGTACPHRAVSARRPRRAGARSPGSACQGRARARRTTGTPQARAARPRPCSASSA